jgi:hypothetical protein
LHHENRSHFGYLSIIQAALETLDWPVPKATFSAREGASTSGLLKGDTVHHGKKTMTIFEMWASSIAQRATVQSSSNQGLA